MSSEVRTLKQIRQAKGLTQKEIAEVCHVKQGVICNWEKGRNRPRPKYMASIASAYGISIPELESILAGQTAILCKSNRQTEERLQTKAYRIEPLPPVKRGIPLWEDHDWDLSSGRPTSYRTPQGQQRTRHT